MQVPSGMDLSQAYGIGEHWKIAVRDTAIAVPETIAVSTQVDMRYRFSVNILRYSARTLSFGNATARLYRIRRAKMILPQVSNVAGSAATTAGRCCPTPAIWTLSE